MPTKIRPIFPNINPTIRAPINLADRFRDIEWSPPTLDVDGVLEGGSALGPAYLGSLRLLEQSFIWFKRVAGNSTGAITAALIAAGYRTSEIEWLCSPAASNSARPAGVHPSLQPIDFMDFLDFPAVDTISLSTRRKTLLWGAIKGQVIDNILNLTLPIPTRKQAVDEIVSGLKGIPAIGKLIGGLAENTVRTMLDGALHFLPTRAPKLKDFQLFDTENLRIAFADAIWNAVASLNPLLVMTTQLLYEGSLFEGGVFLKTMNRLLGAKVRNNPDATVQFNQLPIPLAVIGANIHTGKMEVYSVRTHPDMLVAEAVRRSMSLPVIFEPRGNLIVDGGLSSNFPAWLLTSAGDIYWPEASIDAERVKIGFSLDETAAPPSKWGVGTGKFPVSGHPPRIDSSHVLTPLLIARLRAQGLFTPTDHSSVAELEINLDNLKLLKVITGSATMNQEESVRSVILQGLFANQRFFHVRIPLLGFHGFDFDINNDQGHLDAMTERGWFAARDALAANPTSGVPLLTDPTSLRNPYK